MLKVVGTGTLENAVVLAFDVDVLWLLVLLVDFVVLWVVDLLVDAAKEGTAASNARATVEDLMMEA